MPNTAIIFSRMDSHRLPGKALLKIGKYSLLEQWIRNTKHEKYETIVATSDRLIDNQIAEIASSNHVKCFRGDAQNINQRIIGCIKQHNIDNFARVNGDSPFVFSDLLIKGFEMIKGNDFVTNLIPRAFPYGVSVEVFNSNSFVNAYKENNKSFHDENITQFFYQHLEQYAYETIQYTENNHHDIRLTIDTKEDLNKLRAIYEEKKDIFELPLDKVVSIFKKSQINNQ